MKKAMRYIAIILSIVLLVTIISACNNTPKQSEVGEANESVAVSLGGGKDIYNDPIKIVFVSMSTAGLVHRLYQLALNEQSSIYPNITIEYKDAEYDPNKQISQIEEAVAQGADAIYIEPMDPVALSNAIEAAEDAGVIVITTNFAPPEAVHTLHVAGADYAGGWEAGRQLAAMTGGEGTAIILDAPAVSKPSARMGTGFEDYITQNTNIVLLEPAIGIENWAAENAQTAMRDMLTKYGPGEITMVYCSADDHAIGAMNAIEQAGRTGDGILIWSFSGYPQILEAIKDGKMAGTSFDDGYVKFVSVFYHTLYCISLGLNSRTGNYSETPKIQMPLFPVTMENVDYIMGASRWYR